MSMMRCTMRCVMYFDDETRDTFLTVVVLLLPCISVKRASNIVPFNAGSRWCFIIPLLFSRGVVWYHSQMSSSWCMVVLLFVASFLGKKA